MGRIMSFGQDGRMVRDFDKSEHDFLRRYGRTPEEVMAENARMRELIAQAIDWYRRIGDHGEHTQCHKCPIEPTCGGGKCMFPDYIIANATEIGVMG